MLVFCIAHKVSELDKQKEEEAKILHSIKEASALMSVSELAKGVVYTEPLVTGSVHLCNCVVCELWRLNLTLVACKYFSVDKSTVLWTPGKRDICTCCTHVGGVHQDTLERLQRVRMTVSERSGTF